MGRIVKDWFLRLKNLYTYIDESLCMWPTDLLELNVVETILYLRCFNPRGGGERCFVWFWQVCSRATRRTGGLPIE